MRFAWWLSIALLGCVEEIDDHDGDGLVTAEDCDDANAAVGGPELYYEDLDGDGYGSETSQRSCVVPDGWTTTPGDCDDLDETLNPDTSWYADTDEDDYGDPETATVACEPLDATLVRDGTDCDDDDDTVHPGALDPFYDGRDDDCDGANDYDADADGYVDQAWPEMVGGTAPGPGDCDDDDDTVHPNAADAPYDGTDADCDGANDYDADGDGYVDQAWPEMAGGTAPNTGDCDDDDASVWPGAGDDFYDGIDGDCDGANDFDADADGYVDEAWPGEAGGTAPNIGDCDDDVSTIHPDAVETYYDGVDTNCDQANDYDADADGYVDEAWPGEAGGTAPATGDCDDDVSTTHPDAVETYYDGVDANCDQANDYDADADGWVRTQDAGEAGGTAPSVGDCDDDRADVNPAQVEIWYDGTDGDCDGWNDWDQDHDGFTLTGAPQGTADDCIDTSAVAHPGTTHRVPDDFASIQDAIDATCGLGTVTVAPGTHIANAAITGQVTLVGDDRATTILEPSLNGPVLYLETGTVRGLTVRNGTNPASGGCIQVSDGLGVVLEDLTLTGCTSQGNGGALSIDDSTDVTVTDVEVADSTAAQGGGGVAITLSDTISLTRLDVHDNTAGGTGGGLYAPDGYTLSITDTVITGNIGKIAGGLSVVRAVLTDVSVLDNFAANTTIAVSTRWGEIHGLLVDGNWATPGPAQNTVEIRSPAALDGLVVRDNGVATEGLILRDAGTATTPAHDVVVEGNRCTGRALVLEDSWVDNAYVAGNNGTGVWMGNGAAARASHLAYATVVHNLGDGLHVAATVSGTQVHSSVFAYNGWDGIHVEDLGGGPPSVKACDVWGSGGFAYSGMADPTGTLDDLAVAPGFISFSSPLSWTTWDLHLGAASPLRDAGLSTALDPDASRADIGYWGGPAADQSYYADTDADGLYDGWEQRHGLDIGTDDSAADPDADGLDNAQELVHGTLPFDSDTDNDGQGDGVEVSSGKDPLDPTG